MATRLPLEEKILGSTPSPATAKNHDMLQGIRQVVKPAGVGFISIKKGTGEGIVSETRDGWAAQDNRFFAYYELQEFSQILQDAGFTPILSGESECNIGRTHWLEFMVRCDKS